MTTSTQPDELLSVPAQGFSPLPLGLDDALPVSMVLLLGYSHRLDPKALQTSLRKALQAFPHLTGRLHLNLQPLEAAVVPADREVRLEWVRAGQALGPRPLQTLETLDQATLAARFAPSAAAAAKSPLMALQAPLLQLRLTWLADSEACVLGLMVSHMALDGIGLALFLEHLAAGLRGAEPPAVVHDRRLTFPNPPAQDQALPPHHREVPHLSLAMAQEQDPQAASPATVFSIPMDGLEKPLGQATAADGRLFLAAHLCGQVAVLQPSRRTVALWCNTRGLGQVPRNYTGNAGCYVHLPVGEPVEAGNPHGLFQHLKRSITRRGFAEITDTYGRLKAAEASGRYVFWEGPGDHLLSLNLVPPARGQADFGKGSPEFGLLLTRNVSGLRLFSSPDAGKVVVEASFAPAIGAALMASCERLGLAVQAWHRPG